MSKNAFRGLIALIIVVLFALGITIAWGIGSRWGEIKDVKDYFNGWGVTKPDDSEDTDGINTKDTSSLVLTRASNDVFIPEYNDYDYNNQYLHDYYDKDLRKFCENINNDDWFYLGSIEYDPYLNWCLIIDRQFAYRPVNIYVSYKESGVQIYEYYGSYNVVYEILRVWCPDSIFLENNGGLSSNPATGPFDGDWNKVKRLIEQGIITTENLTVYDYFYTELELLPVFKNRFCHSSDFSTYWHDYDFKVLTRSGGVYASINTESILRFLTVGEEIRDLIFEKDGLTREQIDHTNDNHPAPNSHFLNYISQSDISEYQYEKNDAFIDLVEYVEARATLHKCESVCGICGGCLNETCMEKVCAVKCSCGEEPPAEHQCESICEICGGCLNKICTEEVCAVKCSCTKEPSAEHQCESVCGICGGCLNETCMEKVCAVKCSCGEEPPAEHQCESICEICGGCLNESCIEDACAKKCICTKVPVEPDNPEPDNPNPNKPDPDNPNEGDLPAFGGDDSDQSTDKDPIHPVVEHKCESVCPDCGGCTDNDCAEFACETKCSCQKQSGVSARLIIFSLICVLIFVAVLLIIYKVAVAVARHRKRK